MQPLNWPRVGPGLTFVSKETLALRLQAIGMGDPESAGALVNALGLGSVLTPDGVQLYHWEGLCLRLMEVLGRNQQVVVRADAPTAKVHTRVAVDGERYWDDTYGGATEAALLCLMLDEAFSQNGLKPERAIETARLIREVLDVADRTNFGLGQRAGEPGPESGAEPLPS
jgi:hypothetical protein